MGKQNASSLGRALFKSRFSQGSGKQDGKEKWLHTSDLGDSQDWNKLNLNSITEQSSLDDFLSTAELAGVEFESERLNINFVKQNANAGILTKEQEKSIKSLQEKNKNLLRIPRRPFWKTADYDAATLQAKERESFLEWRRNLAQSQDIEKLSMTPFEKNLEFWRQLWRVIERSDVIVQIVDARNPLLFYCEDLEAYVKEVDEHKLNLLLVNKSDYLTEKQRYEWQKYFESKNIKAVFWSAYLASEELLNNDEKDKETRSRTISDRSSVPSELESSLNDIKEVDENQDEYDEAEEEEEGEDNEENEVIQAQNVNKFKFLLDEENAETVEDDDDDDDDDNESTESIKNDQDSKELTEDEKEDDEETDESLTKTPSTKEQQPLTPPLSASEVENVETKLNELILSDEERQKCRILNREELIDLFKTIHKHIADKAKPGCTTIGLVGYPNVGKSSTINALLMNKKVAVSETPGKTKHYQTLYVDDDLLLCDCPGLVFPSFVSTRGELIINGILPIDQMKEYVEPLNLVIHHIPKQVIEMFYGIELPKPKEGQDPNRPSTAEEVCSTYAFYKGYMNHKGMPDVQRAARYILKDYVNGKLLFCYPPAGLDSVEFQNHKYDPEKERKYAERIKKIKEKLGDNRPKMSKFDKEFFAHLQPKALTKGGIVGYHRKHQNVQRGSEVGTLNIAQGEMMQGKPWKKHFNGNKKEKLRRKTSHFDQQDYY